MRNLIKTGDDHKSTTVSLEVFMAEEGDYIVAYCPALDLSTYGDDEVDAQLAFDEALEIFFEDTNTKGTLEKVLHGLGWTLRKFPAVKYDPPKRRLSGKYRNMEKARRIKEEVLIPVD